MKDPMLLKKTLLSTLIFALFVSAISLFAGSSSAEGASPLFSDTPPIAEDVAGTKPDVAEIRQRYVEINQSLLGSSAKSAIGKPGGVHSVLLNLFDNASFTALFDRVEKSNDGQTTIWVGKIDGIKNSSVSIAITGGITIGSINPADGRLFKISYAVGVTHKVAEIDPSKYPPEEEPIPVDLPATAPINPPKLAADDGSIIDVLVVYTPAARASVGGTAAMTTLINLAISETNTGLTNAGVTHRVNLVHEEEVTYTESGSSNTDLTRLRSTSDGYMDNVHTLRDTYKADVVSLITDTYCGLGYVMTTLSASFESSAFSLVSRSCATGYYSFAHEIGHNMGSRHDRANTNYVGVYSYSYGYQSPTNAFRTIMAYNCPVSCTRLNYWSNPDVLYGGEAMGSTIGNADEADNRTSLNNVRTTAANWRVGSASYTLSITNSGGGTVTADSGAINCGATCTDTYASGTTVTLTATPSSGYTFWTGWGGSCSGVSTTCQVTISANTTVSSTFAVPARLGMYRAYNPTADYHFFTTSFVEFANAVSAGYNDETSGPGFPFYVRNDEVSGTVAVYRLYNPNNGRHYYTGNEGEKNYLVGIGWEWQSNKIEGYIYTSQVTDTTEVFKLYNNNSGVHLYTASATEKDSILAAFPGVWIINTSLGYAYTGP